MIYVECNPDTVLAVALVGRRNVQHERGKSRVCKVVQARRGHKGMVDEDPWATQPTYLNRLQQVGSDCDYAQYNIKVLQDTSNGNRIVLLCPRLEEWLLETARAAGIDVGDYHLPTNAKELHDALATRHQHTMDNFRRLLEALSDTDRLRTLKELLVEE